MLATDFAPHVDSSHGHIAHLPTRIKRREALADHLVGGLPRTINAREHIFREGDVATHVYKVEAGHVCIYRMVADGRRQVMDFAYPGDIIGLGSFAVHAANAQATTKTRIRCIPIAALHELVRNDQAIGLMLYEAMSLELLATRELLFTVSQRTAAERVAAFLVALSRRNERRGEDGHEIVLPMTRADIADYLGLTIETVSRTFTKFRVEGHIELEQCILVTLLDRPALAGLADGACPMTARN
ncbi:MAG: helix-turn-helix domain-containing protein [Hyphomicrobiaceae bacterium]